MRAVLVLLVLVLAVPATAAPTWTFISIDGGPGQADAHDLADLDGDGNLDIVTAWEGGQVRLHRNLGNQGTSWLTDVICWSEDGCESAEDARFADLDQDGRLDVASVHESTRRVLVHWQTETGWEHLVLPAPALKWDGLVVTNVDGASGPDLLLTGRGGLYLATSTTPRVASSWTFRLLASAYWIADVLPIDLDRDGDLDLVFADRGSQQEVAWLEQRPSGWVEHLIGSTADVKKGTLADLSGDGRPDVIFADSSPEGTAVTWFEQPHRAVALTQPWTRRRIVPGYLSADNAKAVAAGDLNRDGTVDLAVSVGRHGALVYWMRFVKRPTEQRWRAQVILRRDDLKLDRISLLDMDGDADLDVLTTDEFTLGLFWLRQP